MWSWAHFKVSGECLGAFLNELLQLFRYPPGSAPAFLAGAVRFASKFPSWRLPVPGHAAGLVTAGSSVADIAEVQAGGQVVGWVSGSGLGWKSIRINRKPLHTSWVY